MKWSASTIVRLVQFDPGILEHLTNSGGVSIVTHKHEGSVSVIVLSVDIDVRMCQEQWNHCGSTVINASVVQ